MNHNIETALYLFPVTLGDTETERSLPSFNNEILSGIKHFIVENIRTARRFLKKTNPDFDIDSLSFYELNEHTAAEDISDYLKPLEDGHPMGILSEAGCPAIADPGAAVVSMAQTKRLKVIPLVGPSSIILSLMASGFNGQNFAFNGYLPVEAHARIKAIKDLEQKVYAENQTQIFIETPYRNDKLMADLLKTCRDNTRLCVAADITCAGESIATCTVRQWKKEKTVIGKTPCIFLIYK